MATQPLQLLDSATLDGRLARLYDIMNRQGVKALLVSDNANKFYLTGRIFDGYIYVNEPDRQVSYFVRRPAELTGQHVHQIRKPELIPETMDHAGLRRVEPLGLEQDESTYATVMRLANAMGVDTFVNADSVLMQARAVKDDAELKMISQCGVKHTRIYKRVPHAFQEGMSDVELQIEIERLSRLEGSIGIMRVSGGDMEINMGSVLVGHNADTPSPYDFALGGAGTSPALPVGADGTIISPGNTVMVDTNGDFNGYMTDMTRTFTYGDIPDDVRDAHQLSVNICHAIAKAGIPGVQCADLYLLAEGMVRQAKLEEAFMGHRSHAGFVGHGVGITVNELPVLSPKSKDVLQVGNVIALEPKFVFPKVGAVGIENTYVVTPDGMKCLTGAPEELVALDH